MAAKSTGKWKTIQELRQSIWMYEKRKAEYKQYKRNNPTKDLLEIRTRIVRTKNYTNKLYSWRKILERKLIEHKKIEEFEEVLVENWNVSIRTTSRKSYDIQYKYMACKYLLENGVSAREIADYLGKAKSGPITELRSKIQKKCKKNPELMQKWKTFRAYMDSEL